MIKLTTNHGAITLELDAEKAPRSAANFLAYVEAGHYDNTIFHRVIDGFMIQGGGFAPGMDQKPVKAIRSKTKRRTASATKTTPSPWPAPATRIRPRRSSSSMSATTTSSTSTSARTAGATASSVASSKAGRGRQDQGGQDRQQGLPPERAARRRRHRARRSHLTVRGSMLTLHGTARFVSDLHLRAERPDLTRRFATFLADTAASKVEVLFILGDLFEYWIGDDDLTDAFNADVCALLRGTVDMGAAHLLHGRQPRLPDRRALCRGHGNPCCRGPKRSALAVRRSC
jgi:cyclophilin family peptidyl-prolyl cis-trans isomerase